MKSERIKSKVKEEGIISRLLKKRESVLALIIIVMFVFLSITNSNFLTWSNLKVIISSLSVDGIIVIGMTIILISGGIDLSVGSTLAFAMTITAKLIKGGLNTWGSAILGICAAAVIGLIIGLLVTRLKLTHFIVTLCFMGITRGLVYILTSGQPISLVNELKAYPRFAFLGQGMIGGVFPMAPFCFLVIAAVGCFFVKKSVAMRKVFYTGSSENAARYSGINVNRVKVAACIACETLAGIAGIIYMIRYSGVAVSAGNGAEMVALSAAVIGGCSMNGGKGSIIGAIFGLVFIVLIQDAMTLMMVPSYWQDFVKYFIVLLAVCLDGFTISRNYSKKA